MFDVVARKDFRQLFDEMFDTTRKSITTDFKEKDGKYTLVSQLAGFDKDDIKITLNGGYLTILAEKEEDNSDEYSHKESYSKMSRSFYVGRDFLEEDFTAKFENGLLTIEFDKKEPKQIEVKTIEVE